MPAASLRSTAGGLVRPRLAMFVRRYSDGKEQLDSATNAVWTPPELTAGQGPVRRRPIQVARYDPDPAAIIASSLMTLGRIPK
ncbi:hypothetical protein DAH66_13720 [Sphingomonas koreensis]|uniref:Uncharacterized protein n=1 Tax=Sphingomonas koreensis TaxID=93064 RepID=A0A430G283_9SPHN|nr:hypothetical protein DAH66_13720 [Sphingomonas koreensis]